jgi:S-adenosylmethionine:diacylglycerol 3-amino-3-carboxypropyl transferase
MANETPWEAGRFDAKGGRKKILFGRMYEDAAIEEAAFAGAGPVFCIASAGCTAMKLAQRHVVTAVDINPVQLAYAEQRAAGGAIQIGSAERVVGIGRRLMALFGWRRRTIESFLDLERPDEQMAFWNRHLNRTVFRNATDALLSLTWLRSVYAAPFLEVLPPRFGRVLRGRLERCWRTHPNRANTYARALLLGDLPDGPRPTRGEKIRFVCADAAAFLESCEPGSFDGFTLSNILDGAPDRYRERLFAAVRRAGKPDAIVVLRSFAEPQGESSANQATLDRSILWGIVDVRPVDNLP